MMNKREDGKEEGKPVPEDVSKNGIPWRYIVIKTDGIDIALENAEVASNIEFIGILEEMVKAIRTGQLKVKPRQEEQPRSEETHEKKSSPEP